MTLSQSGITLAHALVGWGLCGATMGIGLARLPLKRALVVHAVAAPLIFGLLSVLYFERFAYAGPLAIAAAFTGVVVVMDVLVVAMVIQRSFAMFRGVLGTWLPFGSIFGVTYLMGHLIRS